MKCESPRTKRCLISRHVGTGRQAGIQCDPSGVAAHHLDQHHSLMGFGGAVQPVDGLAGDGQRGVMPECHIGAIDVVVDRLRHADYRDVLLGQPMRGRERAFATDRDEHVDAVVVQRLLDLVEPGAQLLRVNSGGTQHGPALGQQAVIAVIVGQVDASVLKQSTPPVLEADDRRAVSHVAGPHDRTDHRV
jgi:hypothetical protein